MPFESAHLLDEELLLAADGELQGGEAERIREHLADCFACRERMAALAASLSEVVELHRASLDPRLTGRAQSRERLESRLAAMKASAAQPWLDPARFPLRLASAGVLVAFAIAGALLLYYRPFPSAGTAAGIAPASSLTPGATRPVSLQELCGGRLDKNGDVLPAVQQQVFAKYGLRNAQPSAYEVDYLITPALGGADDIRNLWPQPYTSSVWNAHVKDELEDRLHAMVCSGQLDLATAQHDIATDWIASYKKYFHTDKPAANRAK